MNNETLERRIEEELSDGASKGYVLETLVNEGFAEEEIRAVWDRLTAEAPLEGSSDTMVTQAGEVVASASVEAAPSGTETDTHTTEHSPARPDAKPRFSAWMLLREGWQRYTRNVRLFTGVLIAPLIVGVLFLALVGGLALWLDPGDVVRAHVHTSGIFTVMVGVGIAVLILAVVYVQFLSIMALLHAITIPARNPDTLHNTWRHIVECYTHALKKWGSFMYMVLLTVLMTLAALLPALVGILIGTESTIVPLVLLIVVSLALMVTVSVYLGFSIFTFWVEGKRGMEALVRSAVVVHGQVWTVVWYYLCIGAVMFAASMVAGIVAIVVLFSLPFGWLVHNVVDVLAQLITLPLSYVYSFLLFEHIRRRSNGTDPNRAPDRAVWIRQVVRWGIILGIMAIPVGAVAMYKLVQWGNELSHSTPEQYVARGEALNTITDALELYYLDMEHYPETLYLLVPEYLKRTDLVDPVSNKLFRYDLRSTESYEVCTKEEDGGERCRSNDASDQDTQAIPFGGISYR